MGKLYLFWTCFVTQVIFHDSYFMNDWYPTQDAKRVAFYRNFITNIDEACALLGVPASTFAPATAAAQAWLDAYQVRLDTQKRLDAALALFQRQGPVTEKLLRGAAKQIKGTMNVPGKVLAMLDMGTGGDSLIRRVAAQAPRLRISLAPHTVVIKYQKMGHEALRLYGCRTGEDAFQLLGTYTLNRIEDERPNLVPGQPEIRQYYALYVDKDHTKGTQSGTVSVVVGNDTPPVFGR